MSDVLDYVREKDPRFKDVPDDDLTLYLGSKQPDFLKDDSFKSDFQKVVAEKSVKIAVQGTGEVLKILSNPLAAEASSMARHQRLEREMDQPRTEAERYELQAKALGVAEKAAGFVAEMSPLNMFKRTLELPTQLEQATGLLPAAAPSPTAPLISPEGARAIVDYLDPHSYDEPGSMREGVKQFIADTASGLTSPDQAAAIVAGVKEPELVGRLFQIGAAEQIPQAAQDLSQAIQSGDKTAIGKASASLFASAAIPAAIEKGLAEHGRVKPTGITSELTDFEKYGRPREETPQLATVAKQVEQTAPATAAALSEQATEKGPSAIQRETTEVLQPVQPQPVEGVREVPAKEPSEEAGPRSEQVVPEKTQVVADYERYLVVQQEMQRAFRAGDQDALQKAFAENEQIKERYKGFPPPKPEAPPTVTETTPKAEPATTPTAANARPAIRLVGGEVVTGEAGQTHPDIIAAKGLTAEQIDQRGFVDDRGNFLDREQAAQQTGLPTEKEAQRLHSTDLPEAQTEVAPATMAGAAHVSEVSEVSQTGLKNAVGEMERVGLGLHGAPETVQRNMAKAWTESEQLEAQKPGMGANLAAMLSRDPDMGLTDTESALLLRHKVDLFNRMNDAAEATHVGDEASRRIAQARYDELRTQYGNLLDAVKARGTEWGREGRWRQAMSKEDFTFSSVEDMNRYRRTISGEDLPGDKLSRAEKMAGFVKKAQDKAAAAMSAVIEDLKSRVTRRPDMRKAEQDALDAASKTVRENAIRIADAENKARVAQTVRDREVAQIELRRAQKELDASQKVAREAAIRLAREETKVKERQNLDDQAKAARRALDAASKTVREAAARRAKAESESRVAKTVAERKTAAIQAKAAQKAVDAADKQHRQAAIDLAKAERKLRADPIRAVWDKVKEQIEKGEDDFDLIRGKVAIELGMKADQVGKIMAQDQRTKRLTDEAWRAQQKAGQLREQAKRWVAGAGDPEAIKLLKSIPAGMFGLKVFGHGTVPLGTHAPAVAFMPKHWATYAKRYGTMYHMVFNKAFYQSQVKDLESRKNYITARRGGLVNDPKVYEDYTQPELAKYFGGGQLGTRGFMVLKILRQDMFDTWWDKLPKSLQTDEMASLIADTVNHETGVIKAMAPRPLTLGLFAPRLLGSRLAFAIGDPAKAAYILTKQIWERATPEERQFAMHQLTSKAMILGTYYGLLAMNQGLLAAFGSDQKINGIPESMGGGGFDPMRSDFLKFKIHGMDFAYGNALLSLGRLPSSLYRVISSEGGKAQHIVYDDENVYTVLGRFTRSQLSPFAGTATDLAFGADYASRPLPSKFFGLLDQTRPVPKRLAAEGLEPYSWPEYWSEQLTPIPFQEALREAWKYGLGMSDEQIKALERAAAATAVNWGTGGRVTEDIHQ